MRASALRPTENIRIRLKSGGQQQMTRENRPRVLNCPHNETKLKQNSFETVLKHFLNCFVSISFSSTDSFKERHNYIDDYRINSTEN